MRFFSCIFAVLILWLSGCSTQMNAVKHNDATVSNASDLTSNAASAAGAAQRPYRLAQMNAEGIPPLLAGIETREAWQRKREEIMREWLAYVGELPQRPKAELRIEETVVLDDHIRQKVSYPTAYADRVSAYLLLPKGAEGSPHKRFAAMLALHPTNALGKDSVALPTVRNRMYGLELVRRGYVVLVPDALTSGERIYPQREHFDSGPFYAAHPQWTTVGKNLTDHLQAMDVLSAHPLVDSGRIGAIGHSFGAYNAYFLASVDERVRVVVASCGVSPFTNTQDPEHWGERPFPYTHFPQNTEDMQKGAVPFEFNEIIALSAPRPQFYYAAQGDVYFRNWQEVAAVFADVKSLYRFLGSEDAFESLLGAGGHDFPPRVRAAAYDFIDSVLKADALTAQ